MRSDAELLRLYTQGSHQAFEDLSQRYAAMVFGICRRILKNDADAEDAAQAVFLALIQKAPALQGVQNLGGWLFSTASTTARYLARSRTNRRRREENPVHMKTQSEPSWDEIAPHLDWALSRISERYRRAVMLRYLAGQSRTDTAALLGVHEDTVSVWIDRGLEQLRKKLAGRGLLASAGALSLAIESHQFAAPQALLQSLGHMAAAGSAGAATACTAQAVHAANGTLKLLAWSKVKMAVASVLFSTALGAAAIAPFLPAADSSAGVPSRRVDQPPAVTDARATTPAAEPAETKGESPPPATLGPNLLLDESAYCRAWHLYGWDVIDAVALKTDGERVLGKVGVERFGREVQGRLADRKIDWTKTDWRDYAVYRIFRFGESNDFSKQREARTALPPPKWSQPDFDDGEWMRLRLPFAVGSPNGIYLGHHRVPSPGLRGAWFRYPLDIADPAKAGALALKLVYNGGARVFVNGKELSRGHLPQGEIGEDALAEGYPEEAYMQRYDEIGEKDKERAVRSLKGKEPPKFWNTVAYLPSTFEAAVAQAAWVTRPMWERVSKLRNRELGPLAIPAGLLRPGANVIAVEIRAAGMHPLALNPDWHGLGGGGRCCVWLHANLVKLEVASTVKPGATPFQRPAGVQVWGEDMHTRIFAQDFLEPGASVRPIRLVGARNGTYCAQVVVGTERELSGVRLSAGDLKSAGSGAALPATAISIAGLAPQPIGSFAGLGEGRISPEQENFFGTGNPPTLQALLRYTPTLAPAEAPEAAKKIQFFDRITKLPEKIAAGSAQPYWISLKVPPAARPGLYAGQIRVEAQGLEARSVPVELEIVDWRVPDALDFHTLSGIEHSPYGVAKQYKVALWSEEHWKLIEASLRQLAKVSNDWWFVPVLLNTEFGNRDDQMIKWTRKKDGSWSFDYGILNRYLDLVTRHCGAPRVVSFVVMHGAPNAPVEVKFQNEASGAEEKLRLGGDGADPLVRRNTWNVFGNALYNHMRSKGLERAMYWGYAWDTEGDPTLKELLKSCVPEVSWSSGSHNAKGGGSGGGGLDTGYYQATAEIYSLCLSETSKKGWSSPRVRLNTPRVESTASCVEGHSPPFAYRLLIDRVMVSGFNGIGRIGGDYWAGSYYDGMKGAVYHQAGFPILTVLWPGENGAESSVRLEALREGMQEAEARVFLEQALERKQLSGDLAQRAQQVLYAHNQETLYVPSHMPAHLLTEGAQGWLTRSRRLYQMAAEAGAAIGLDVDQSEIAASLAPYAQGQVRIKLRNWTGAPRAWKAASSEKWIVPEKSEGSATQLEDLVVRLAAENLEAEKEFSGTLTVTDTASGRVHAVKINLKTGKVFEFVENLVFNVTAGSPEIRDGIVLPNKTGKDLAWKVEASVPWLKAEPPSGQLAAGQMASLKLVVSPPDAQSITHAVKLAVTVGSAKKETAAAVHVIPPYAEPALPAGQKVWLLDAITTGGLKMKAHKGTAGMSKENSAAPWSANTLYTPTYILGGAGDMSHIPAEQRGTQPYQMGKRTITRGLWAFPPAETTYALEGSGVTAFSVWVGYTSCLQKDMWANRAAVANFEIYVDGQLRAQSGLVKVFDEPRLLVVTGLENAKEIKLLIRRDTDEPDIRGLATWGDPTLYKK